MPDERDTARQTDSDDVEGHGIRRRTEDEPAPEGTEREEPKPDADDDVEGHGLRR